MSGGWNTIYFYTRSVRTIHTLRKAADTCSGTNKQQWLLGWMKFNCKRQHYKGMFESLFFRQSTLYETERILHGMLCIFYRNACCLDFYCNKNISIKSTVINRHLTLQKYQLVVFKMSLYLMFINVNIYLNLANL